MADPEFYIKQQRLGHQPPPNQSAPSKFYTQFMYKAVIVVIFLVILPFFPSQAPDFINQSLDTRSWELVQLLLVGIAVSYGLFSRINNEPEKEHSSKFDDAQSYVSRLLQVSSVFEDDSSESPFVSNENKVQTWSSQYSRGEPVVVVAQENSVIDEEQSGSASSRVVTERPLLFPVRSLKSRVTQPDFLDTDNESSGKGVSLSRSSSISGSKRFSSNSNKTRNGEVGGSIPEMKAEENVVLRSPIPWRSRLGRMEMKEETDNDGVPLYSLPPSMEESDFNQLRSQPKPSPMSISSSKNTFSSQSSESQSNSGEVARKKIYYKSSPPPAPPLPPPLYVRKPPLVKSNSTPSNPEVFPARELKRSAWIVPEELINGTETGDMQNRANSGAESRPRVPSDGSLMGKSVRTIRPGEPIQEGISKTSFVGYKREEKQEFEENVVVETDEESESEDVFEGGSENDNDNDNENENEEVSNNFGDVGKDVDKKADEFIAKFREQIRLQRIESIKRSTGLISENSNR